MTKQDDDREGAKPYRTYKARRPRRSQVDDELAGARPTREPPRSGDSNPSDPSASSSPPHSEKAYRTYGPASDDGRKDTRHTKQSAGSGPRRRRRIRWWYIPTGIFAILAIAAVILTVLAWPGYQKFDRAVERSNRRIDEKTRAQLAPDDGWIWRNGTTILLLGVDMKATETVARSDTILLMRFNPKTHTINQLAVPRDTKVDVPGHGTTKINEAMFYGGSALAVETIQQYTGIPINHVMVVTFEGFPRIVNAVGGIDMYVPQTVTTEAGANRRTVQFTKGMHHFDGKYAMLYVRIRKAYVDGDFTRARRQQAFVQALQKKIVRPSNIPKLPDIGTKFMNGVATDLTTNQILTLSYLKWRADGGKKLVMAGTPGVDGGVAYVFPPDEAAREKIVKRFLGE